MSMGKTIRNNVLLVQQNRKFWSEFEKGQVLNIKVNYNLIKAESDKIRPFQGIVISINEHMLVCRNIETGRIENFTFADYLQNEFEIKKEDCKCQDCKSCMIKLAKQLKTAERIAKGIMKEKEIITRRARFNF